MTTGSDDLRPRAPAGASDTTPDATTEISNLTEPVDLTEPIDAMDEPAPVWIDTSPVPPRRSMGRILGIVAAAIVGLAIFGAVEALVLLRVAGKDENAVVATVNGDKILRDEYDRAVAARDGGQVLDSLILQRLVDTEAKKRNITVDPLELEKLVGEQKSRFDSDAEFEDALKRAGLTIDELRTQIRLNELVRKMVADKTTVTDQEVAQQYEKAKAQFQGKTLDQVRDQVREMAIQQKESEAVPALLDELKSAAKIETFLPGKKS